MHDERKPLEDRRICFVSTAEFGGVWRTWKQANTVVEAGGTAVIVGYDDLLPDALRDSRFEVVAVPRSPRPLVPAMPTLDLTTVGHIPELEPSHWLSSSSRSRVIRALVNRSVNYLRYRYTANRNARRHARETTAYRKRLLAAQSQLAVETAEWEVEKFQIEALTHFEWQLHSHLIQAIINAAPDTVQAVDLPALDTAWKASRTLKVPLIYAAHEFWAGFVNNPDLAMSQELGARLLEIERIRIQDAAAVSVPSDLMGYRLREAYGIDTTFTLLNSPMSKVSQAQLPASPLRLVFHGGLSADRCVDTLIRAVGILGDAVTLAVHGYSRTASLSDLEEIAEEVDAQDRVKLWGAFDYKSVVELLKDYDVCVLPGRVLDENFNVTLPNKLLDAMCAGLAAVSFDAASARALFDIVPYGLIVDTSSPESLAVEIKRLVDSPETVARMKRTAVESAPEFWWPTQSAVLIDVLTTLAPCCPKALC